MDPIVLAAGTALVAAMATDAWQHARSGIVALWQKARPEQASTIERELTEVRAQVLEARRDNEADVEQALAGFWQIRLRDLLREQPTLTKELRRILNEELTPLLGAKEQARIGSIAIQATANDHGRVYQAGRD